MTIRDARNLAHMTQKGVSELVGVPIRTIQAWESGARKCPEYVERLVIKEILTSQGIKKNPREAIEELIDMIADTTELKHELINKYLCY